MTGIFPEEWNCSKVVPVFKQGDHTDLEKNPTYLNAIRTILLYINDLPNDLSLTGTHIPECMPMTPT